MVELIDTTLREGEQTPGVTFSINEKLIIADLLDDFGIDIIEAGHPIVSKDVFKSIKLITSQNYKSNILAHCRAKKEDIDAAISCDVDWIGIFFCVSKQRLEQHFKIDLESAINQIVESIQYAKDHGLKVRYTPEDTTRTDYKSLLKVSEAAINAGADRISIADTVGAMIPVKMYNLVKKLKSDLNVDFNVHCHNDLGLATANSLAAYEAGAKLIDVTVNGLGERAGITSLSEICLVLHSLYMTNNNWKLEMLPKLSQTISEYSGINISQNTPIIGKNAFIHNAGLHVAAILNDPVFYEAFPAELIGRKRTFILDKMAGIQTIKHKMQQVGLTINNDNVARIMHYVKSKDKGIVSDDELRGLLNIDELENVMFQ
jgi:2-isopropylmalate synthase